MIDKKELTVFLSTYEKISEEAMKALQWYTKNVRPVHAYPLLEFKGVCTEDLLLIFEGEDSWGGYTDHLYETLPLNILYDSEARDVLIKEEQDCKNRKQEEEQKRKESIEKEERETLKRLQEKYGNG